MSIAKFPFYLNNMVDTAEIVATIVEIRNVCESAQDNSGEGKSYTEEKSQSGEKERES